MTTNAVVAFGRLVSDKVPQYRSGKITAISDQITIAIGAETVLAPIPTALRLSVGESVVLSSGIITGVVPSGDAVVWIE